MDPRYIRLPSRLRSGRLVPSSAGSMRSGSVGVGEKRYNTILLKRLFYNTINSIMYFALARKAHFGFGWMNVDINLGNIDRQKQRSNRIGPPRN